MTKSSWLTAVTIGAVLGVSGYSILTSAESASAMMLRSSQTRTSPAPKRVVWAGVYTNAQAARGKLAYAQFCSRCHRADLSGNQTVVDETGTPQRLGPGPQLKGQPFFDRWHDLTLLDVFAKIQDGMPHDYTPALRADSASDIVSFLLNENGIPAGDKELSANTDELRDVLVTRPPSQPLIRAKKPRQK